MMPLIMLPFILRSMVALWALLLCCAGIVNIIVPCVLKQLRNAALALPAFSASYFFWQVLYDLYRFEATNGTSHVSRATGNMAWGLWILFLAVLTTVMFLLLRFNLRYSRTFVTPMAIKECWDEMDCGICYYREDGRVIFSNQCMNRLCIMLTNRPLMNGLRFSDAVSDVILPVEDKVWSFSWRDLEVDGSAVHELIATDVTEIRSRIEELRKDTEELERHGAELKAYSFKIDETVRRQEILQAKINIHDEMNRLMLSTVTADIGNDEETQKVFSQWEKSALLLCLEADERKEDNALEQITALSKTLGLTLVWKTELPQNLTARQRELFFAAAQEAIANAVKHGCADSMEISFQETGREIYACFENSGRIPEGEVIFTGGLSNLALLASEQQAKVSVKTGTSFILQLTFPKAER